MKITYNWLAQYVDFDWPPEELSERLTMLGLEVEKLERVGGGYEGVVAAEVLSREPHPNADRLSLCRVSDGKGERQIVCGATNFKPGDKVPLILPGNALPTSSGSGKPSVIKAGKIRGVVSEGMLCSGKELGVSEDADGLMILDSGTQGDVFDAHTNALGHWFLGFFQFHRRQFQGTAGQGADLAGNSYDAVPIRAIGRYLQIQNVIRRFYA